VTFEVRWKTLETACIYDDGIYVNNSRLKFGYSQLRSIVCGVFYGSIRSVKMRRLDDNVFALVCFTELQVVFLP
jgi:hypothetical protein